MIENITIDFENEDFWKSTMQKSVAKRMLKRNKNSFELIKNVCKLSEEEIKHLKDLNKSCIRQIDLDKREKYLEYYMLHKYEVWECKRILDLNEIDIYEICEGKGQTIHLDFENMAEGKLYNYGIGMAKNLALIKMTDLKYSKESIIKILGDDKTESMYFYMPFISSDVINKMKAHFINKGISDERYDILINLLKFENNIENASSITGFSKEEIKKIISDNHIFKSDDEKIILDKTKIEKESELCKMEILIECLSIDGMYEDQIEDYCELSGLDEDTMKKIYDVHLKFRQKLDDLLGEMACGLMENNFDFDDIEEICGISMFGLASEEYYFNKYRECLRKEFFEAL